MSQKKRNRRQRGSITVEAALVVPLFMFAFIAIISLALIARVECITQYAIDQTAKELSQYCYIADRAGLLKNASGESCTLDSTDDVIDAVVNFQDLTQKGVSDTVDAYKSGNVEDAIQKGQNTASSVREQGEAIYGQIKSFGGDNPVAAVKVLATSIASEAARNVASRVVAIPLCKALVPKYITKNTKSADDTLKHLGIEQGLDGLNFGMSSILKDGRTIQIVCIYKVKVMWFFGGEKYITVKQTANTAAWMSKKNQNSLEEVAKKVADTSKWDGNYGTEFVSETKKNDETHAVKSGVGIDLYNHSTNTFTEVHSMNVFNQTYSKHTGTGDKASDYTLNKSKIKSTVKSYAKKEEQNVKKIDEMIVLENGTEVQTAKESVKHRNMEMILYVPQEAKDNADSTKILDEIASEIEAENNVKVIIRYEDKAFTEG